MTYDEIMALDADGLRLAVAEALGYIDNRQFCENEFLGPDREWYYTESAYEEDRVLPDWPRDISAAWGLVEEAKMLVIPHYLGWAAGTSPNGEFYPGPTAPLAICRAWLMWKAVTQ